MTFLSEISYVAAGGETEFTITFPFLAASHVKLQIEGVAEADFTVNTAGDTLTLGPTAPTIVASDIIRIYRETPNTVAGLLVDPTSAATLSEADLDTLQRQLLFVGQEARDTADRSLALLQTAQVAAEDLPSVGVPDASDFLVVGPGGTWDATDPADARTALALADRATTPFNEIFASFTFAESVQEYTLADWKEIAANKLTPTQASEFHDGSAEVGVNTDDIELPDGKWIICVYARVENISGSDAADVQIAVTDEVNGPSQTVYDEFGIIIQEAASAGNNPSESYLRWLLLDLSGGTNKIAVRARNNNATGLVSVANPSGIFAMRVRS